MFECLGSSTISSTIWIYTSNGEVIYLVETNENKFAISSENELIIRNLDFKDDGFYACGYSPSENVFVSFLIFNLFVKGRKKRFPVFS
jgi:hypothetical protein